MRLHLENHIADITRHVRGGDWHPTETSRRLHTRLLVFLALSRTYACASAMMECMPGIPASRRRGMRDDQNHITMCTTLLHTCRLYSKSAMSRGGDDSSEINQTLAGFDLTDRHGISRGSFDNETTCRHQSHRKPSITSQSLPTCGSSS